MKLRCLLIVSLLLFSISIARPQMSAHYINDGPRFSHAREQDQNRATGALRQQAEREARQFWFAKITQCGQDYFTRNRDVIHQFKNLEINVTSLGVSQADELNGVQWRGRTTITAGPSRVYSSKRTVNHDVGWSKWSQGLGDALGVVGLRAEIRKEHGRWLVVPQSISPAAALQSVSCTEGHNPSGSQKTQQGQSTTAMLRDAASVGIYVSHTPQFPMEYFRTMYSRAKNGNLHKTKVFPGGYYVFFDRDGEVFPGNTSDFKLPTRMQETFRRYNDGMREVAIGPNNSWIEILPYYGVTEKYVFEGENIPITLSDALKSLFVNEYNPQIRREWRPRFIALGPNEHWVLFYGQNNWKCYCSTEVQTALRETEEVGFHLFKQFIYTDEGEWLVLFGEKYFKHSDLFPKDIINKLTELHGNGIAFDQVILAPNGAWMIGGKFSKPSDWSILR